MFNNFNKLFGIVMILILLVIIPSSFALNTDFHDDLTIDESLESISNTDLDSLTTDYYINGSSDVDGDGTIENPYNELTLEDFEYESVIHLTDGEYILDNGTYLNKVIIIGQSPENTIIRYNGTNTSGVFLVSEEYFDDNYLILKNITLIGFNLEVVGSQIEATNTIFKDTIAHYELSGSSDIVNEAVNSLGGAIHAYDYDDYFSSYMISPKVTLDNCTFINNSAEYGGAISIYGGVLEVSNSLFVDNYAYRFGGAISARNDVNVKIKNSKFVNDTSIEDAGGAIYLLDSKLDSNNVSIINCSATFGAAITSLSSSLTLNQVNAINNSAKYDGGAIYQMYNSATITDSYFSNNYALNGGAIFADDLNQLKLTRNDFVNNQAVFTAGAVYTILTTPASNGNTFSGNKAKNYNDTYETDGISLNIGNGNYTLIYNNSTFTGQLPNRYSLLDYNLSTPVRDQQDGGNCWAFGSLATLESAILKASGLSLDLSEGNMKNVAELYSDYGWNYLTNDGGKDDMAIGYLVSWLGPVLESEDKYDDYGMLSPIFNSFTHVQNILFLSRSSYTDNDAIKQAIMNYGAVSVGIYYDSDYFSKKTNSYYYRGSDYPNHAVAIVGWDDNYSRNNFVKKPAGNGAWIVKNSWNTDWGDEGYFYVSYYDSVVAEVGEREGTYVFVFNDSQRYDKNYQYDIIGKTDYFIGETDTIWVENIFEASDNEILAAVSTYFREKTDYELFIYVNDELALNKNGTCVPGYITINLGEYIPLYKGDKFKVVFKFTADDIAEFAISEKVSANKETYFQGISFFSSDGENWIDLYNYKSSTKLDGGHTYTSQVAAIKAFTVLYEAQPQIIINTSNTYNLADIEAVIYDLNYDNLIFVGDIVLTIGGDDYTVKIQDSKVNLSYVFDDVGLFVINANYRNLNSNATINISKINITVNSNIKVDKNNVLINLDSKYQFNTTVDIIVNNKTYYIDFINGNATLTLNDLDSGNYDISVNLNNEVYKSKFNLLFNVTILKADLYVNDLTTYYNTENDFVVQLKDSRGNPVANRLVYMTIGGNSYTLTTDLNGNASTSLKFGKIGSYPVNIFFKGDDDYFACNATAKIDVKSTINFFASNYLTDSLYTANLLTPNGYPLSNLNVNLIVDGMYYTFLTDGVGNLSVPLNFGVGNHEITVINIISGEQLSQSINVVSRIMENKNMNVYYLSGSEYKIRVYGDDGMPVGEGEAVKVVFNKKTTYIETDSDGYATFKISSNPNTYTITATYKNYKVSNKIVVKPLLTAKNISKKKAKKIKFTAKLVNTNGKVVKGKKITFKIKGKTYTAKTNSKGIATVYLKNLKVGKYTITTKYGKSTIKNTVKIRK